MSERFRLESYLDHIPQLPNYHSVIKWYNGKVGEISDVENVNVYRFYEGNYDHTVEISQGKEFPAVFAGISAYWIKYRRRNTVKLELDRHLSLAIGPIIEKDTSEIFEEYTSRRYEELHDEYKSHPDNWDWDWDFVFFVKTIIWKELVLNSAVKVAMKGFLPPEEEELVCRLMDNYIKYLKKQRKAKGYEVSSEYLVLRGVQDEKSKCYFEDLDRAKIISTLDALEAKGYVKVAWVEGHDFEDAMILPKGKERLRELEEQIQNHQVDAKHASKAPRAIATREDCSFEDMASKPAKGGKSKYRLPAVLDTKKGRAAINIAIEAGWMKNENGKLTWDGVEEKGKKTQLAYFVGKIFGYVISASGNKGNKTPWKEIQRYFGIETRMNDLLYKVGGRDTTQPWQLAIDEAFENMEEEKS